MFAQSGAGFLPRQFQTDKNYTTTFSGPIKPNENNAISARNESMAKAAFGGDDRQYSGQMGKGVQAGSKMSAFRAGLLADAEAGKGYAQAQQDQLNRFAGQKAPELEFQERLSGEQGWLRDLLLDRDDVRNRERMAAYKRKADVDLQRYDRTMLDAQQSWENAATIAGAMM
jgi:hypothetical protein